MQSQIEGVNLKL